MEFVCTWGRRTNTAMPRSILRILMSKFDTMLLVYPPTNSKNGLILNFRPSCGRLTRFPNSMSAISTWQKEKKKKSPALNVLIGELRALCPNLTSTLVELSWAWPINQCYRSFLACPARINVYHIQTSPTTRSSRYRWSPAFLSLIQFRIYSIKNNGFTAFCCDTKRP